ncbi:hypothetical protein FGO68_gene17209 [Halteria grandinella]|uniref:Uncharacterized protein n=1 Tax=Halteria grandinella TaxID=5974 RepID=A0A8J8NZC5_HALGN|nr:hypothetical protein FGO68_gene17209 [Halteria grandinella]
MRQYLIFRCKEKDYRENRVEIRLGNVEDIAMVYLNLRRKRPMNYMLITNKMDDLLKFLQKTHDKYRNLIRVSGVDIRMPIDFSVKCYSLDFREAINYYFVTLDIKELKVDLTPAYRGNRVIYQMERGLRSALAIDLYSLKSLDCVKIRAYDVLAQCRIGWSGEGTLEGWPRLDRKDEELVQMQIKRAQRMIDLENTKHQQSQMLYYQNYKWVPENSKSSLFGIFSNAGFPMPQIEPEQSDDPFVFQKQLESAQTKQSLAKLQFTMKLIIREDEADILLVLPYANIKHLILKCYCDLDVQHILALSKFQKVTYAFVKNESWVINNSLLMRSMPRSIHVYKHSIHDVKTLRTFLLIKNFRNVHYMNPNHPLELRISNLKTLCYLRQVFVPGVKSVRLIMNFKFGEHVADETILEAKKAYDDQRLKRDAQYSTGLHIQLHGDLDWKLACLMLFIFSGSTCLNFMGRINIDHTLTEETIQNFNDLCQIPSTLDISFQQLIAHHNCQGLAQVLTNFFGKQKKTVTIQKLVLNENHTDSVNDFLQALKDIRSLDKVREINMKSKNLSARPIQEAIDIKQQLIQFKQQERADDDDNISPEGYELQMELIRKQQVEYTQRELIPMLLSLLSQASGLEKLKLLDSRISLPSITDCIKGLKYLKKFKRQIRDVRDFIEDQHALYRELLNEERHPMLQEIDIYYINGDQDKADDQIIYIFNEIERTKKVFITFQNVKSCWKLQLQLTSPEKFFTIKAGFENLPKLESIKL